MTMIYLYRADLDLNTSTNSIIAAYVFLLMISVLKYYTSAPPLVKKYFKITKPLPFTCSDLKGQNICRW